MATDARSRRQQLGGAAHVRSPDSTLFSRSIPLRPHSVVASSYAGRQRRHCQGQERLSHGGNDRAPEEDIADKGIKFFDEIDQSKLAADAGIKLRPSVLLVFGNPLLGTQFITANANAGLDWPVRLLVFENDKGEVWTAYTDFDWIARRHGIKNRNDQFKMASSVITSITSSVKAK